MFALNRSSWGAVYVASAVLAVCFHAGAQEKSATAPAVDWQQGPAKADVGGIAEIEVPSGYRFTGAAGTRTLMDVMQNPVSGRELGFMAADDSNWFLVFEFNDVGYVKDDEKDKLDAAAMLESIRKGTEAGNKERAKRGWPTMTIVGWEQAPKYDPVTNNLEWAVRAESEGKPVVNYNTRLLGRKGVMEVALVASPDELQASLPAFKNLLTAYSFKPGERYAEFRQGDKLAKYGLAALVTGGAALAAAKTGLLAKLGKLLMKGGIIVVAVVAGLMKKIFGRKSQA